MGERVNQCLSYSSETCRNLVGGGMAKASPSRSVQSLSISVKLMTNFSRYRHTTQVKKSVRRNIPVTLMQPQEETTSLVQQINQIILNSSNPEKVLQQMAQAIGEGFRVDHCFITVKGGNSDQTQRSAGGGSGSCVELAQTAHWDSDNQLAVLSQQQILGLTQLASLMPSSADTLAIEDIQATESSLVLSPPHLLLPVRAILGIPTCQGKIYGMILLMRTEPYYWTDTEKEHVLALASPAAIALSQVVQTKQIAALQQQVQTSAQYQTLINKLMMASRSSLELQQILQLAIAGTAETLDVERGLILLLKYASPVLKNRDRREHIPKAKATVVCEWLNASQERHHYDRTLLSESFWLSECRLCQQAFKDSPRPVTLVEPYVPTIDPARDIAPLFKSQPVGSLIFPMESQDIVLGFFVLQHSSPRLWQSEELALLELVSAQISSAIIQSQTLQQVQTLVEERTVQLQSSLEIQLKLYEKMRQQVDQLRQFNQLQDEFLSNVNHELRTPLTSMSVAIRLLRQPGLKTELQTKYLDILEQQCDQEIKLVNDLLQLQELQSDPAPLQLEIIDLKLKIRDLVQSFEEKWADKGLNINIDLPKASLLLQTEVDSLDRILQELFTNAGKYSDPDTAIVLKVNQQANQIVLNLTNIGADISPEEASQLFDKFRRGRGITQKAIQGTGLGLALVKCLVQHLNGTINVSICPDHSTRSEICFTLTLPKFFELQP